MITVKRPSLAKKPRNRRKYRIPEGGGKKKNFDEIIFQKLYYTRSTRSRFGAESEIIMQPWSRSIVRHHRHTHTDTADTRLASNKTKRRLRTRFPIPTTDRATGSSVCIQFVHVRGERPRSVGTTVFPPNISGQSAQTLAGRLGGWLAARSLAPCAQAHVVFLVLACTHHSRRRADDVKTSEQRSWGAAKPDRGPSIAHIARHTHAHTVTVVRWRRRNRLTRSPLLRRFHSENNLLPSSPRFGVGGRCVKRVCFTGGGRMVARNGG